MPLLVLELNTPNAVVDDEFKELTMEDFYIRQT